MTRALYSFVSRRQSVARLGGDGESIVTLRLILGHGPSRSDNGAIFFSKFNH